MSVTAFHMVWVTTTTTSGHNRMSVTAFHMVWVKRKEVHHNCMVKHQKKECLCFHSTLRKVHKNKANQQKKKKEKKKECMKERQERKI